MELIFLVVGVGLGFVVSRVAGLRQKPQVLKLSEPLEAAKANSEPVQVQLQSTQQVVNQDNIEPQEVQPQPTQQVVNQDAIEPVQEELKQTQMAYEMAKEACQFKAGFLARTSHELRSPLSSLIGMHQLILSDLCDSPEEEREFVAQANTSALKMVKVLAELTDVSKLEHGKTSLEISAVPLTKILENLQTLTHMQAANSNLRFEVVPPDSEIYVTADQRRFQQVLVSLVDTTVSRMESGSGSIRVSAATSPESQQAQIWIDIESAAPMWSEAVDLLSTTPETTTKPGEKFAISQGLNLLMAQSIIEVMQGRLELVAAPSEELAGEAASEFVTRLQCSMPLSTPASVEQALA